MSRAYTCTATGNGYAYTVISHFTNLILTPTPKELGVFLYYKTVNNATAL